MYAVTSPFGRVPPIGTHTQIFWGLKQNPKIEAKNKEPDCVLAPYLETGENLVEVEKAGK
jgi:hypothetical protein